jgi:hypothetical protein
MKLWISIRQPIGVMLFGIVLYGVLVALHVIPEFLLAAITGTL